jgi:hypothetical protein
MNDWLLTEEPYAVASNFNGATLYPLSLVKEKGAKYDIGDDGQRCEHIGYNLAMPFVTNPKWNFHIMPNNPGGPTGVRSLKNIIRIMFLPKLSMVIFIQMQIFLVVLVLCVMAIALQLSDAAVSTIKSVRNDSLKLKETELPLHYSDFMYDEKDVEYDTPLGKRHLSFAAKRTSPKASPTTR